MRDECLRLFIEESFEHIQSSEEALIRLENKYSKEDIDTIFRNAHSLKGSSASMNFIELSSLTHKIEDLLDGIRKEDFKFDKFIINVCFKGFDLVNRSICQICEENSEIDAVLKHDISEVEETIDEILGKSSVKGDDKNCQNDKDIQFVEFSKIYYAYFIFDNKSLMLAARRFLVFSAIRDTGDILFANPPEKLMTDIGSIDNCNKYQCLFSSNKDINELYNLLNMDEVELVRLVDVSERVLEEEYISISEKDIDFFSFFFENFKKIAKIIFQNENIFESKYKTEMWLRDFLEKCINMMKMRLNARLLVKYKENIYSFINILLMYLEYEENLSEKTIAILQKQYIDIWSQIFDTAENKVVFKSMKLYDTSQVNELTQYVEIMEYKKFRYFLLDISMLEIIEHEDIENLIKIKRTLNEEGIKLYLINNGIYRRIHYYIFESIAEVEFIKLYYSNIEAVMEFNWKNNRKYLKMEEYGNDKRELQNSNC